MNKFEKILKRCKCGVYLEINIHRDDYMTAEERLDQREMVGGDLNITDEVKQEMIKTNTIVELTFYPDTPVGSFSIYHYDLDAVLDQALDCLDIEVD